MQINSFRFGALNGQPGFQAIPGVNTLLKQNGSLPALGAYEVQAFKLPGLGDKFYANFDGSKGFVHCNIIKSTGQVFISGENMQPSRFVRSLTDDDKAQIKADTLALRQSFEARDNSGDYAEVVKQLIISRSQG